MTVKAHYDQHLASFYSWMLGDFQTKKNHFLNFCQQHNITPQQSSQALDLGAGHGIQSIALAEFGFDVTAIDFNQQLLDELIALKNDLSIKIQQADFRDLSAYASQSIELITCCGDTISHLDDRQDITQLISQIHEKLSNQGKVILSFRDYTHELKGTQRFIPVKSDDHRILTCFLEYTDEKVRVTDLLQERNLDQWEQKVSTYEKVRISEQMIVDILKKKGFKIDYCGTENRMVTVIGEK